MDNETAKIKNLLTDIKRSWIDPRYNHNVYFWISKNERVFMGMRSYMLALSIQIDEFNQIQLFILCFFFSFRPLEMPEGTISIPKKEVK